MPHLSFIICDAIKGIQVSFDSLNLCFTGNTFNSFSDQSSNFQKFNISLKQYFTCQLHKSYCSKGAETLGGSIISLKTLRPWNWGTLIKFVLAQLSQSSSLLDLLLVDNLFRIYFFISYYCYLKFIIMVI